MSVGNGTTPHSGNNLLQAAGKGTLGQLAGLVGLRVRLGHLVAVNALPPEPGDVPQYTRPEYSVTGPCFHPINALVSSMEQVEYVCAETDWNDNAFRHHQNSVKFIK